MNKYRTSRRYKLTRLTKQYPRYPLTVYKDFLSKDLSNHKSISDHL